MTTSLITDTSRSKATCRRDPDTDGRRSASHHRRSKAPPSTVIYDLRPNHCHISCVAPCHGRFEGTLVPASLLTLCYCCGQEALESGSRWSVWFCEDYKEKVIKFNTLFQQTVIPIGRHSLMSDYRRLSHRNIHDLEKIEVFFSGMMDLFARMDILHEWRAIVMRKNMMKLAYVHDALLADYLRDVRMALDKSKPFDRMLKFFSRRVRKAGAA